MKPQTLKTGKLRTIFASRKMRYGSNAVVLTIAVVAIVLMVNFLVGRHSWKLDLTKDRFYTLSDATCEFLKSLDQQVKITAFFAEGDAMGEVVRDLLREYTRVSPKVSVEFVDPDKMPSLAKQYDITAYGTSVVEAGLKSRKVMEYELLDYETSGDMANFAGEQAFTRALISLFAEDEKYVYFSIGHDERDLTKDYLQTKAFLEGEGYIPATCNLAAIGRVPQDAAALVIAGPRRDFTREEVDAVESYLERGGKVIVAINPLGEKDDLSNLKKMLRAWGIGVNDDLVVDPGSHYSLDMAGLIPKTESHQITEKLIMKDLSTFLPRSRSLYHGEEIEIPGITVEPLLVTTDKAWGETDFASKATFDPKTDIEGPLTLAYAAWRKPDPTQDPNEDASGQEPDARLIVIGNASFLDNDIVTFQGNIDFFMNSVGWMVGKRDSISIRPKSPGFEQVYLSDRQAKSVFYWTVAVIPAFFAILGVGVWVRRRHM